MKQSFIKKILSADEAEQVSKDLKDLHDSYPDVFSHCLNLKHDINLITKSIAQECLLLWNIHCWAHFNGEKWDGIFIGIIRKSEKFNKKMMDEYIWFCPNGKAGLLLYEEALAYAKQQGCEYMTMNLIAHSKQAPALRNFYKRMGYSKDTETYIKNINNQ